MRRGLLTTLAVATLIIAPLALAGTKSFSGSVPGPDPGEVKFAASGSGDPYKQVKNFDFEDVAFNCEGNGPTEIGTVFEGAIKVKANGKFNGTQEEEGTRMTVKGRFDGPREASGTLRLDLFGNPEFGSCYTGNVRWEASR